MKVKHALQLPVVIAAGYAYKAMHHVNEHRERKALINAIDVDYEVCEEIEITDVAEYIKPFEKEVAEQPKDADYVKPFEVAIPEQLDLDLQGGFATEAPDATEDENEETSKNAEKAQFSKKEQLLRTRKALAQKWARATGRSASHHPRFGHLFKATKRICAKELNDRRCNLAMKWAEATGKDASEHPKYGKYI